MARERERRGRGIALTLVVVVVIAALAGRSVAQDEGEGPPALDLPAGARIGYHNETGMVRFVGAPAGQALMDGLDLSAEAGPEEVAGAFVAAHGHAFGVEDVGRDLAALSTPEGASGRRAVRYQQYHQGVPILGGELVVQVDGGGRVLAAAGEALPALDVDVTPRVPPEEACRRAVEAVSRGVEIASDELSCSEPTLWIYNPALLGGPGLRRDRLVWRLEVQHGEPAWLRELVLVDAHVGAIALRFSLVTNARVRRIHDNGNNAALGLPGTLVRAEGAPPTGLADADAAYAFLGDAYDLFFLLHGYDGWDGAGAPVVATTRYCQPGMDCPYPNAFWNGAQLVFGEGYALADDVVAHEFTHAVTEHTSHLFYYMQSGAINEAFSDIWGEFIDLANGFDGRGGPARWLMGEDMAGGAARSLSDPPAYGYTLPDTGQQAYADRMTHPGYYCGGLDNGGVHLNYGIGAKAAYLMAEGGSFNGHTVAPLGIPKTAALFWEVQTQLLTSGAGYADLHDALIQAAHNLVADGVLTLADVAQVQSAVAAVEMDRQPPACAAAEAPVCTDGAPLDVFADDLENPRSGTWAAASLSGTYNTFYYPQNPNDLGMDATYARSGVTNIWGYDQEYVADFTMAMTRDVMLPPGAFLRFDHAHSFEAISAWGLVIYADGGVVEYSTDRGATWHDAGPLFTHNGYSGELSTDWGNPLGGRRAFTAASRGYVSSRLDLAALAGQPFRLRFRMGTDDGGNGLGWFIDDIRIFSCRAGAPGVTPSVGVTPSATRGTPTYAPPRSPTPTITPTATPHRVRFPAVMAP